VKSVFPSTAACITNPSCTWWMSVQNRIDESG
jgi:hypothetical protein